MTLNYHVAGSQVLQRPSGQLRPCKRVIDTGCNTTNLCVLYESGHKYLKARILYLIQFLLMIPHPL